MYYRFWDRDCNRYMATGYNTTSKEEAKEAIIAYIVGQGDNEEAVMLLPTLPIEEICALYEFDFEESETEFETYNY